MQSKKWDCVGITCGYKKYEIEKKRRYNNDLFAPPLDIPYNLPILSLSCCFYAPGRNLLYSLYFFPLVSSRSLVHSFASPSVVTRTRFYPRGREESAERRERKEDRKRETGGIVVRVRYRCRRDTGVVRIAVTATAGGGGVKTVSSPAYRDPSLNHPSYCEGRHCQDHPSTRLPCSL